MGGKKWGQSKKIYNGDSSSVILSLLGVLFSSLFFSKYVYYAEKEKCKFA